MEEKLEIIVKELSDAYKWNWAHVVSERDAADKILELLAENKFIKYLEHPMGGSVWMVNNKIFGRRDGMSYQKFNKMWKEKQNNKFIEQL